VEKHLGPNFGIIAVIPGYGFLCESVKLRLRHYAMDISADIAWVFCPLSILFTNVGGEIEHHHRRVQAARLANMLPTVNGRRDAAENPSKGSGYSERTQAA
jgi:hypothetical protein